MGSAMRIGPGYFPTYAGAILTILGVIIAVTSFKMEAEAVKPVAWRPMILLSFAFSIFAWSVDAVGLALALLGLIFLSALASRETFKFRETVILSVVVIVGSWALFIVGLQLPFSLFWWR